MTPPPTDPADAPRGRPDGGYVDPLGLPPLPRDAGPSLLYEPGPPPDAERDRVWLHLGLFLATLASTVWAGGLLVGRDLAIAEGGWRVLVADGLRYAVPFLAFLTVHEFGHYLAARRHRVSTTLPYFIPVPLPGTFGTFGAVIRIREPIRRLTQLFDIGVAGPLPGFVVALVVYVAGLLTLPGPEYFAAMSGHEASQAMLAATGQLPPFDADPLLAEGGYALLFGETLLTQLLAPLGAYRVPPHELSHFPLLLAGWLGLFFTALNLLPVGQLDGGHVVYAMFGPRVHAVVARVTVLVLTVSAGLGALAGGDFLGMTGVQGWAALALAASLVAAKLFDGDWRLVLPATALVVAAVWGLDAFAPALAERAGFVGWWLWIALLLFVVRVDHPPVRIHDRLSPARRALGWACVAVFLLTFSLAPLVFVG